MRRRFLAFLTTIAMSTWAIAEEDDFRVAMITHSDEGRSFVVIEFPDGQQALLREGAMRGSLQVVAIGQQTVEVTVDGVARTLRSDYGKFDEVEPDSTERGEISTIEVDMAQLRIDIDRVAARPRISTTDIGSVFGLLGTSKVVAVNQEPVDSNRGAVDAMQKAMTDQNVLYKIETRDPKNGDHQEIYIVQRMDENDNDQGISNDQ